MVKLEYEYILTKVKIERITAAYRSLPGCSPYHTIILVTYDKNDSTHRDIRDLFMYSYMYITWYSHQV